MTVFLWGFLGLCFAIVVQLLAVLYEIPVSVHESPAVSLAVQRETATLSFSDDHEYNLVDVRVPAFTGPLLLQTVTYVVTKSLLAPFVARHFETFLQESTTTTNFFPFLFIYLELSFDAH